MATKTKDQRTVIVEINQAELNALIVDKAKQTGLIDFTPDRIQVMEADAELGTHHVIFEVNTA